MSPHSRQREQWLFRSVVDADREKHEPPPAKPDDLGRITKGESLWLLLDGDAVLDTVEK